jgi:uncharacterized protein with GYD domain
MSKFVLRATYLHEGVKGLLRDGGTDRHSTIEALVQDVGGTVEAFYYALGADEVYAIADFPDHASALVVSATVNASEAVSVSAVPVLTPEEVEEAKEKAGGSRQTARGSRDMAADLRPPSS